MFANGHMSCLRSIEEESYDKEIYNNLFCFSGNTCNNICAVRRRQKGVQKRFGKHRQERRRRRIETLRKS